MKRKITRLPIVFTLLVLLVVSSIFFTTREAAPKSAFNTVQNGMTKLEVIEILGDPFFRGPGENGETIFFYGGLLKFRWCSMEIFFGENKTVTGKFHDH